jgi:hypothetical protein
MGKDALQSENALLALLRYYRSEFIWSETQMLAVIRVGPPESRCRRDP